MLIQIGATTTSDMGSRDRVVAAGLTTGLSLGLAMEITAGGGVNQPLEPCSSIARAEMFVGQRWSFDGND